MRDSPRYNVIFQYGSLGKPWLRIDKPKLHTLTVFRTRSRFTLNNYYLNRYELYGRFTNISPVRYNTHSTAATRTCVPVSVSHLHEYYTNPYRNRWQLFRVGALDKLYKRFDNTSRLAVNRIRTRVFDDFLSGANEILLHRR